MLTLRTLFIFIIVIDILGSVFSVSSFVELAYSIFLKQISSFAICRLHYLCTTYFFCKTLKFQLYYKLPVYF